jgi:hypothetical protein
LAGGRGYALAAWVGEWRNGDNRIVLHADGSRLTAEGDAFWPAANAPYKGRAGGQNVGDMSGATMPERNIVVFAGDDPHQCHVTLTLLPPFLLAADDKNRGRTNVSFTGVYLKRQRRQPSGPAECPPYEWVAQASAARLACRQPCGDTP